MHHDWSYLQILIPAREDITSSAKLYYMNDKILYTDYLILNC